MEQLHYISLFSTILQFLISANTAGTWTRTDLIDLFNQMIPEFNHKETGKFLDGRM